MKIPVCLFFLIVFLPGLLPAQVLNQEETDQKTRLTILSGLCSRKALLEDDLASYFPNGYYRYCPDTITLKKMIHLLDGLQCVVVMGNWCPDSRKWVPPFFRIWDELKLAENQCRILCVNRNMKSRYLVVDSLNIEKIPTFVLYRNAKELGRIVEHPRQGFETDLLKLLQQKK